MTVWENVPDAQSEYEVKMEVAGDATRWFVKHLGTGITRATTAEELADLGIIRPVRSRVIDAALLERQRVFSERAFGPGRRTLGITQHIRKELAEIIDAPDDLEEWIDVAILALDGAWRAGANPTQIIEAYVAKLEKNEAREWPDWRESDEHTAIEHVRGAE